MDAKEQMTSQIGYRLLQTRPLIWYSLGRNTVGMNAAVVAHVTGYGYADTADERIPLVAINTIAVLHSLLHIRAADGIGAAEH